MLRGQVRVVSLLSLLLILVTSGAWAQAFEPQTLELTGTVRDFRRSHPDMQFRISFDPGIVEPLLGEDGKPVYTTSRTRTATTNGREPFDQWYRDVEGVNLSTPLTLPLTNSAAAPGIFTFDSGNFFPIDGQLFGNEGMAHNYYFTFELHSRFTYRGGEVFNFRGDDDVFVFINGHLVIDLGGVHGPISSSVSLDAVAGSIGLEIGGTYDLDFFFAERFCCGSNFRMQTSILLEQPPEDPCGNGELDPGEQCDDGNTDDGDGCSAVCEIESLPPVALCQDADLFTEPDSCAASVSVDAGSFDPEGEPLSLAQSPSAPYGPGAAAVTLTATDPAGAAATCGATVTVSDREPPLVSCNAPALATGGVGSLAFTATSGDNCQPPAAVTIEVTDATCRDDDLDDDGVPDDVDECPGSDLSDELVIAECATGAPNVLFPSGCTFSDLVVDCAEGATTHGDFVSCVSHLTNTWRDDGLVSGREKGAIERCAARAPIPPGSTGNGLRDIVGSGTAEPDETACPVSVDGATVTFPETPGIGELAWTVTATDGFGNTTTEACTVLLQNPVTPLPNLPPVADAGDGATVLRGQTVGLDGSESADLNGDELTFAWTLTGPAGSAAALSDPTSATPTFVADLAGIYRAELVVSDGRAESRPDAVDVLAFNSRPLADAGPDATAFSGDTVSFDGTASADPDGDPLGFFWVLAFQPAGSTAVLTDPTAAAPILTVDRRGTYVAQLTVSDGGLESLVDAVILRVPNAAPVADAGPDQQISVFDRVELDGSGSSDLEGDPLAFQWTLLSVPAGSTATLSDPTGVDPTFDADLAGTYVAQLVVSDGPDQSAPDTVEIVTVNTPPVAHAGPDRTAFLSDTVMLDGTASFDPDGDALAFQWTVVSRPAGSTAALSDPTSPQPTIQVDVRGVFELQLVVDDGQRTSRQPDTVRVTVVNRPPVAEAGADRTVALGDTVALDGSGSFDPDGDPLTFSWSFVSRPAGSSAVLSDPAAVTPTFEVDAPGTYVVSLVVDDGFEASAPDTVTVITLNSPPVADAGPDQEVQVGDTVQLDGSASFDVDGDALTFAWSFVSVPAGSAATLSDPTAVNPTFVVDVVGAYLVELVVHDGTAASAPDTVSIATGNVAPVADAGPDQTAFVGDVVQLDGSGSFDANGDPITHAWSFVSVPDGSLAALSNPAAVDPTFELDLFGTYVVQLVASDGELASDPDTVTITTENSRPVAEAGVDQVVLPGATVSLDGSGSFDVDGDALSFSWSLTSVPAGSTAVLFDPTAAEPSFVADVVGMYVAQLIVHDGELDSLPDTVMIEASDDVAEMPDVVGLAQADAEAAVVAAGLTVGDVTLRPSSTIPAGQVIDQDPAAGTTVLGGSAVDLVVSAGLDPDLLAEVLVLPESDTILVGGGFQLTAFAIFGDGTSSNVTTTALWTSSDSAVAQVDATGFVVGAGAGVATIRAEIDGVVGSAVVTVEARLSDGVAPTAQITSPADNATIPGPVDVIGTATDANFLKYELAISPAGDGTFTTIATGTSPVAGGILGTFDPTVLLNDLYDVRLRVFDRSGFVSTDLVVYQVVGNQKVGNFSLTFTDLEVPMAGLPITIQRTYDSRDKGRGDFGVGWRLGIQTLEVRTNGVQGAGWLVSQSGGIFNTFSLEPLREHKVTITLPDGRAEVFDLTPQPSSSVLVPFTFVTPAYTPRSGTVGTLAVSSESLLVSGSQPGEIELLETDALDTYEPETFTYTTPDGRSFNFSMARGVESIRDANGNRITIGASGIFHSAGQSVLFSRDAQNRIVSITDPNGNRQLYAYDSNGDLAAHTDAEGNVTGFHYNFTHGLLEIADPRGVRPIRYEYDDDGRLVATVDSEGNRIDFTHDIEGRQQLLTDRRGNVTLNTYDEKGNVLARTDALGNTTTFTYNAKGEVRSETDPQGNTLSFTYDDDGNVLTRTDALNKTQTFTYNAQGKMLSATDGEGNVSRFTYDARGNRLTETDPLGNTTSFAYDLQGNLSAETDALDNTRSFGYDAFGRQVTETDRLGNTTTFSYDANGNVLSETRSRTDAAGNPVAVITTQVYDGDNRPLQVVDAKGGVTRYEYDEIGRRVASVDALGNRTEFSYDARGNLIRTTFPDGTTQLRTYDPEGNETSRTDRAGNTTTYVYDALNRRIRTIHPDGSSSSQEYDSAGHPFRLTDENSNITLREYDAAGQVVRTTDPLGNERTFTYDARGNVIATTDELGETTRFEYDVLDRLVRTVFPDGTTSVTTYDELGREVARTDQAGNTTTFGYDAAGNLVATTDPLGNVTTHAYDEMGNRVSQTDPNGKVTRFEYDNLGNLIRKTLPLGMSETFTYDLNGNVLSHTDFNGNTTTFQYDANNQIARKGFPDGSFVTYTYTPTGKRSTVTDARGTTTLTYDSRDRLVAHVEPDGTTVSYAYDAAGNVLSVTSPSGTTGYTYDPLNRMVAVRDPAGRVTSYGYDAKSRLSSLSHANGTRANYTYDALDRLVRLENLAPSGVVLTSYDYTLDPAGNRIRVVEEDGRTVDYTYDAAQQVLREAVVDPLAGSETFSYTYDASGNRLTKSDSFGTISYSYDANGRLLSAGATTYTYDANGNTLSESSGGSLATYSYDFEDRMVAAQTPTGVATYSYDDDGLRVGAIVNGVGTNYVLDRLQPFAQVIEERDGAGFLSARYVHGLDLISQERAGALSFYHTDGLGSTRALTDALGALTDTYTFDAFGVLLDVSGSTPNVFLFAGEQLDPETGLYYLRARLLDPSTGRFLTVDPFEGDLFVPITLHRYLYAGNDPINRIDPGGEFFGGINGVMTSIQIRVIQLGMSFPRLARVVIFALETLVPFEVSVALPGMSLFSGVGAAGLLAAGTELGTLRQLWQRTGASRMSIGRSFEKWVIGVLQRGGALADDAGRQSFRNGVRVPWNTPGAVRPDGFLRGAILEIKTSGGALKKSQIQGYVEMVQTGAANGISFLFEEKPSASDLQRIQRWIDEVAGPNNNIGWSYAFMFP